MGRWLQAVHPTPRLPHSRTLYFLLRTGMKREVSASGSSIPCHPSSRSVGHAWLPRMPRHSTADLLCRRLDRRRRPTAPPMREQISLLLELAFPVSWPTALLNRLAAFGRRPRRYWAFRPSRRSLRVYHFYPCILPCYRGERFASDLW